jgi:hypothetical protein
MRLYFGENTKDGKISHLLTLFTPLVDVAVLVAPDSTLSGGFEPVTELVALKLSDCTSNAGEVLPLALPSPTNSIPGLPIALCNSKNIPRSRLCFWTGARRAGSPHHALIALCLYCVTGDEPSPEVLTRLLESNRKSIRIALPQDTGDPPRSRFVQQLFCRGAQILANLRNELKVDRGKSE